MNNFQTKDIDMQKKSPRTTVIDTIEHPVTRDYVRLMYNHLTKFSEECACTSAQMSKMLNKSPGYFRKIESRKAFPSMETFLDFCTVCKIHPAEFFRDDFEYSYPARVTADKLNGLTKKQLALVIDLVDQFLEANGMDPGEAMYMQVPEEAAVTQEEEID